MRLPGMFWNEGKIPMAIRILSACDPLHAKACGHVLAPDTALAIAETANGNLVDLNGAILALTPVAAEMVVRRLETGRQATIEAMARAYDAPASRIGADLDQLWNDLIRRGLIVAADQAKARPRAGRARIFAWMTDYAMSLPLPFSLRAGLMLAFARLSCARCGLAATAEAWRHRFGTGGRTDADDVAAEATIIHTVATRHWIRVDCKERALTCWAVARRQGIDATISIGLRSFPLGGHAWCRVGDRIIGDDAQICASHQTLIEYGKA